MNGYTQGKSGGDVLFADIMRGLAPDELTIVTSLKGEELLTEYGVRATFLITSQTDPIKHLIREYIMRIVRAMILLPLDEPYDLVYSSSDSLPDTLPAWYHSGKLKIPWVARTYHAVPAKRFISHLTQRISFWLFARRNATVITASNIMKQLLKQRRISVSRIRVLYPGVEKKIPHELPAPIYDAVWMARIHPSKGYHDLIYIWKAVIQEHPLTKLAIIGTGAERHVQELAQLIKLHGLGSAVDLLGHVADPRAASLIRNARLFLHTSHEEGFGLTMGEAMHQETPIIAYHLPIFEELFAEAFIAVRCFDREHFVERVCHALQKPEMTLPHISKAKSRISLFSWEHAIQNERALLENIILKKSR